MAMGVAAAIPGRVNAQTKMLTITGVGPSLQSMSYDGARFWVNITWTVKNTGSSPVYIYVNHDCGTWCDGGGDVNQEWPGIVSPGQIVTLPMTVYYRSNSPAMDTVSLTVTPELYGFVQGQADVMIAILNRSTMTVAGLSAYPTITVTPATETTVASSPISQVRIDWCDANDAIVQHTVNWQGQTLADAYVATTRSGCFAAGTSTYNNLAISPWVQNLIATARDAAGNVTTTTTRITYAVPLSTFAPSVSSTPGRHQVSGPDPVSSVDTFTVTNHGTNSATYSLFPVCDSAVTLNTCYMYKNQVTLDPGASDVNVVYFSRSGTLDFPDTLKLVAKYYSPIGGVIADTGRKVVIAPSTFKPMVSRYNPTSVSANGRRSFSFNILDAGNLSATYTLSVSCTGTVTSCTLPNSAATMTKPLTPNNWSSVAVGFNTGAGGSTGQIQLIMTAPPRISDGVVQADTSNLTVNAADVAAPTVAIASFGIPVTGPDGTRFNYVSLDTATVFVDVCDIDGTVGTPTLKVSGVTVTAMSNVATTRAGCLTSRRAAYMPSFFDGTGDVTATVSDGYHTSTQQVWYEHDGAHQSAAKIVALHPTISVAAGYAGVDTFVVTNAGPQAVRYPLWLYCSPNPYWLPCSMDPSYDTVSVAAGASIRVPVSYGVSAVGSSIRVNLSAEFDGVFDSTTTSAAFMVTAAGTIAPTIAVTPANGAMVTSSPIAQLRIDWCDADDALVQHDVTWQGQALADVYVATTRSGCYAAGTSTYTNLAINAWQQTLVATVRDAANHTVVDTATITYAPPLTTFAPHVTPTAGLRRLPAGASASVADTFTVTNSGTSAAAYTITTRCGALGTLATCVASAGSLSLAPGASSPVVVQYTRIGAPDVIDTLGLVARYTSPLGGVIADTGRKLVVAPSVEAVPVVVGVQQSFDVWRRAVVSQAWFTLKNNGSAPVTYALSFSTTGGYSTRDPVPATVAVDPGQSAPIIVNVLTPNTSGIGGSLSVAASYVTTTGQALTGSATVQLMTVEPNGSGSAVIAVSPKTSRTVPANLAQSQAFTVTNSGTVAASVTYMVSCSGAAIISCTAPSHGSASIGGSSSDVVTVSFTTAAAGTGAVKLIASTGTVADTGAVMLTIGATNGPVTIAMNALNPGTSIGREQCLTIAAGDDAAYECGDLRLVHALPTTTTLNKARTPTLIYMSSHAHPVILVAADVTIDGASPSLGGACPSQVSATVRFANNDTATRTFPWTGPCGQLATRRIVVPVDAHAHSMLTGVYSYSLEVTASANGSSWPVADTTGKLVVVNREASPFGAGWWLDGLEQLMPVTGHSDQLLWVGGDGSTRVYTRLATDTLKYLVQPTLDRPDTLEKLPNGAGYKRHLRNGAYVAFDGLMRDTATVNTLGHATQFNWVGSQLTSIVLPVPSGSFARPTYTFGYTNNLLISATAPPSPSGARVATLTRNGSDLSVIDPGAPAVHFLADASNRITMRTNRLGDATHFDYDPTASVLTHSLVDVGRTNPVSDSIAVTFCPAEAASLARCASVPVDPTNVRTLYDGPRLAGDVADTTAFHLTRFGAPDRIINALGQATSIERMDSRWPLLATATVQPNGHRVEATYTDRGLVQEARDLHPFGAADTAKTQYQWDSTFDKVSTITAPTGEVTRFGYFANGDRQWQEDGRGSISRSWFTYNTKRQLQTIQTPGNSTTQLYRLDYDLSLGNLQRETTPKGFITDHLSDALGRDTLVITPTDDAQTAAWKRRVHSIFDLRDRPHVVTDSSVVPGASQPQRIMLTTEYDAEDNPTRITREVAPDPLNVSTIVIASDYDAAGRKVREYDPNLGQTTRTWRFDAAGNVTSAIRGDATSPAVTMEYDALNRLLHRVVPRGVANTPSTTPATTKTDDDQRFFYDAAGNLAAVTNYAARVARTFYPNGDIASDTLHIADADLNESDATRFNTHTYVVDYTYDLSGRRRTMTPPPGFGLSQVSYGYDAAFGALTTVTDGTFGAFRYAYTAAGLLDTLTSADGTRDTHVYDIDGRETGRSETNPVSGTLHSESWSLDARGKRTTMFSSGAIMGAGANELYTYDGLGGVIETQSRVVETTPRDPLGNIINRVRTTDSHQENHSYLAHTTRLRQITQLFNDDVTADTTTQTFLPAGDLSAVIEEIKGPIQCGSSAISRQPCDVQTTDRRLVAWSHLFNSYDAAGRLVSARKETSNDQSGLWVPPSIRDANSFDVYPKFERGVTEEYRYDGLGRRVWVRAYRNAYCPGPRDRDSTSICISTVERSVYDGSQVLLEIRQPGDDTALTAVLESDGSAAGTPRRYFGTVGYLNGPAIDHPLGLVRNYNGSLFPVIGHYHGLYGLDGATRLDGTIVSPCAGLAVCYDDQFGDQPDFAGRRMSYGFVITSASEGPVSWWGTMANMKQNATGALDMRNRVYDPRTGRFTQEDPIGLAGGMNLYGFAGGDPVNYTDPLGLTECPKGSISAIPDGPCYSEGALLGIAIGGAFGEALSLYRAAASLLRTGTTTLGSLEGAASRAVQAVGNGRGAVYGTRVHAAFEAEVEAMGGNLHSEVSYLDGQVVPRATRGSVRLDVVEGDLASPTAIFDLKTGSAKLTDVRIKQIRANLPAGSQDIPIREVRP